MTAITTRCNVLNGVVLHSVRSFHARSFSVFTSLAAVAILFSGFDCLSPQSAAALDVNVSNYSWLQYPSGDVTPIIGSTTGINTTSFGAPSDFRWGDYVWLPTNAMTANATQGYYAGVQMDQARPVDSVRVQWWIPTGSFSVSQYHIDGSNDGSIWTNIGNGGAVADQQGTVTNLAVTPGNYQYVRVRLEGGEYSNGGNGSYGGPGIYLVEPMGSGTVSGDQVNWANVQLGTSAVNTNMPTYNSTTYNDGTLVERAGTNVWTGTINNWNTLVATPAYTTLNLGQARLIGDAIAVWSYPYSGNTFGIEYSTDGTNFTPVTNSALFQYSPANSIGATELTFDPVIATHIRMRDAAGTSGYTLINQLLLHSPTEGVLNSNHAPNSTISMTPQTGFNSGTLTDEIKLENTGVSGSAIGIFSYSITGTDAAEFDLSNFAQTILMDGDQVSFDIDFNAPDSGIYSAMLTFNTSVGSLSFNLESSPAPAPEPSTALLLGLGCLIPLARRQRK